MLHCSPEHEALAFAYDLGSVSSSESVLFAVGVVRDPAIQYTNGQGKVESRSSYFWSSYSNVAEVVSSINSYHLLS